MELMNTVETNNQRIYDAGYDNGKQAEYDAFWDTHQENGNRIQYEYAFAGKGWIDTIFKPKYNLNLTHTYQTGAFWGSQITDLVKLLADNNIEFTTTGAKSFGSFFLNSSVTNVPVMDLSIANSTAYTFGGTPKLKRIEKIMTSANTVYHATTFNGAIAFEEVIFEGVIASNNFDIHWSKKLNKTSIESIINCLSTETSGLTVTLSAEAVANAFTAEEWEALEATKTNWTVSLV